MSEDVFPGGYSKPVPDLWLDFLVETGRAERTEGGGIHIPDTAAASLDGHRAEFVRWLRQYRVAT